MPIPYLSALTTTLSARSNPKQAFDIIAQAFQAEVGYRLLTFTAIIADSSSVKRLWSSHQDIYPAGGTKQLENHEWGRVVLQEQRPIVCNEPADLQRIFADHVDIANLGCSAGVNLPVVFQGDVLGTVNIFHKAQWFSQDKIDRGTDLMALVYAPMLLSRQ
ncbi:GAF domain-containing protein [Methylobacterium sp. J-077]|uniref:GAF domain-containing protein n=1 Tax=Methylobacterium sp. J-077 TaxID=2836656 RepID=UPI003918EBAE